MSAINQSLPVEGSQVLLRTEPNVSELCGFLPAPTLCSPRLRSGSFYCAGGFCFVCGAVAVALMSSGFKFAQPLRINVLMLCWRKLHTLLQRPSVQVWYQITVIQFKSISIRQKTFHYSRWFKVLKHRTTVFNVQVAFTLWIWKFVMFLAEDNLIWARDVLESAECRQNHG